MTYRATQATGAGDHRLTGGTPFRIFLAGLRHNGGAAFPVNSSVNAATGQLTVGGIDDDVGFLESDVGDNQLQGRLGNLNLHSLPLYSANKRATTATSLVGSWQT